MRVTIWDIDNCLADDSWRHEFIDWSAKGDERYDRYNSVMDMDMPRNLKVFRTFIELGALPVFFTGRPEKWRDKTEKWLKDRLEISHPILQMRPNGTHDLRPVALKEAMLRNLFRTTPAEKIIAAFDDLPNVVEMYRGYLIPAKVLAINDNYEAAYTAADLEPLKR